MRLIDGDALKHEICNIPMCGEHEQFYAIVSEVAKVLIAAPTIDAVRHARWIGSWNPGLFDIPRHCTICGFNNTNHGCVDFKHCPGCGARMDAKEDAE